MIHLTLRSFLYSSLWLGMVGLLGAQVPTPPPPPPQLVSFYMVGGQEFMGESSQLDKPATFKFRTAKGVKSVTLVPGMPSPNFTRKAGSKITIFTETPASEPGKPPEVVTLAEAPVPAAWSNVLVLVHLDEASDRLTLKPINQSFGALQPASVSFHNFTRVPLAIKLGESHGVAPPQGSVILPVGLSGEVTEMVRIQVAAEIDGQAKVVSSGSYALTPKDRRTILLAPGQSNRLRMSILDPAPPDPVDPGAESVKPAKAK
jgi:hypothetical protein